MSDTPEYDRPPGPDIADVRRFRSISDVEYPLYVVCTEDAQEVAAELLERELSDEELSEVRDTLCLDWRSEIERILLDDLGLKKVES